MSLDKVTNLDTIYLIESSVLLFNKLSIHMVYSNCLVVYSDGLFISL